MQLSNEIEQLGNDLIKINEVLGTLPETPHERQNIFQIAGFPSREQVISNMLAFYLSDEEHCFGRSLFDSLLNIVERKIENKSFDFSSDYIVEREINKIDLLIQAQIEEDNEVPEWTIIIENKVFASLYNNLTSYWNRTKSKYKIGIVLSLYDLSDSLKKLPEECTFVCITHKELTEEWIQTLGNIFLYSDDRHLLYLKDYIQNINSYYKSHMIDKNKEEKIRLLQQHYDVIDRISHAENDVKQYVVQMLNDCMRSFNFEPFTESWKANGKHFYSIENKNESAPKQFRFWFNLSDLHKYSYLTVYFELYGKSTKYGGQLREKISTHKISADKQMKKGTGGSSNSGYCHLYCIEDYDLNNETTSTTFVDKLKTCLERNFFNVQTGIVWMCYNWINEIIDDKKDQENT